jgi:peptidoglycan/xylan/chitin deacetylase (PgdA/CDA1 family)
MDPATFTSQMQWFQENEYYAVNGKELVGFLDGTLNLPARAVILTTDSGNTSTKSLPRMLDVLAKTGMHFHSFILTGNMDAEESAGCTDDICWQLFREAASSGSFSIGCHSETHRDFALATSDEGLNELKMSKQKIEDRLGVTVTSLSWPYESCPAWENKLAEIGFKAAFGGRSRTLLECAVYKGDSLPYCLPRIFPPNATGFSGRPDGYTLQQIMEHYNSLKP